MALLHAVARLPTEPLLGELDGAESAVAIEAGAFVVAVPQYLPPHYLVRPPGRCPTVTCSGAEERRSWRRVSGSVLAGPLYDAEGIVVADCDLRETLHAKRWFDAVGHYSRADVLWPRDS